MLLIDRPGPASASDFHGRAVDDVGHALRLWWFDPIRPALVLGSTQDQSLLRVAACGERGVDVVKRRSGGGLVYVSPEHTLWADVIVPSSHRVWNVDVGKASEWIGECWLAALMEIGVADASCCIAVPSRRRHGRAWCVSQVGDPVRSSMRTDERSWGSASAARRIGLDFSAQFR